MYKLEGQFDKIEMIKQGYYDINNISSRNIIVGKCILNYIYIWKI